jgi:hypothetical protein
MAETFAAAAVPDGTHRPVVYTSVNSKVKERWYSNGSWYDGPVFDGLKVAATACFRRDHPHIRVYTVGSYRQIDEHCWDGAGWSPGAFNQWGKVHGQAVTATSWDDGIHHIRVYFLDENNVIYEACWDGGPEWYTGENTGDFPASGKAVSACCMYRNGRSYRLRLYVVGEDNHIAEYCYSDDKDWYKGEFSASGEAVAATAWKTSTQSNMDPQYGDPTSPDRATGVVPAGEALAGAGADVEDWFGGATTHIGIRVYVLSNGRITEHCYDGDGWFEGGFSASGQAVAATSYVTGDGDGSNGQVHLRVYVQGSDGRIVEHCYDGDGWHDGTYTP